MNFEKWFESLDLYYDPVYESLFKSAYDAGYNACVNQEEVPPKRKWVGLKDDEIIAWWESENGLEECNMTQLFDFATVLRFITKKLKEKNT